MKRETTGARVVITDDDLLRILRECGYAEDDEDIEDIEVEFGEIVITLER